jgi:hypothetical protein
MKKPFKKISLQTMLSICTMQVEHGSGLYDGHRPREPDINYKIVKQFINEKIFKT